MPANCNICPHDSRFHPCIVLIVDNLNSTDAARVCSILQWELFRLPELESYDAMHTRLFRQDLERIVMCYEAYRTALLREIDRRDKLAKQQRAAAHAPPDVGQ